MQGYDGEKLTVVRVAPSGGVVADNGYVILDEFLVACETAAAGADATFVRVGCCRMIPKTTGQTNTKGAKAYFNATSGKTENAASATNYLIGTFEEAAVDADVYSSVILPGNPVSVGGVPGDIQGVTAGTGLTGGGTSGTVSLAVSFGTTATTACVGDDARLSDDRDPNAHAASHATAGADAITPADIGAAAASHTHAATDSSYTNPDMPGVSEVGGGLDALVDALNKAWLYEKTITVANLASTGSSAADANLVGGRVISIAPVSGVESAVAGVAIAGDGAITVTLAAAQAAGDGVVKVYAQGDQT